MDLENKLVVVKGDRGGSGVDGEFGVGRRKLLYLDWISNEVLLFGELYPVSWDKHDGRYCEKKSI